MANWVINGIIIPDFLHNGIFELPLPSSSKDTLIIDLSLPLDPVFSDNSMDIFTDAAFYLKNEGEEFKPPTTPMRF